MAVDNKILNGYYTTILKFLFILSKEPY